MRKTMLWDANLWKGLVPEGIQTKSGIKKDLTHRIEIFPSFAGFDDLLDFNRMVELVGNKYSGFKVSVALIKSLEEYHNKRIEETVNFKDLAEMYLSMKEIFGDDIKNDYIFDKWKKANGLSFFGFAQYELMEKCLKDKGFIGG